MARLALSVGMIVLVVGVGVHPTGSTSATELTPGVRDPAAMALLGSVLPATHNAARVGSVVLLRSGTEDGRSSATTIRASSSDRRIYVREEAWRDPKSPATTVVTVWLLDNRVTYQSLPTGAATAKALGYLGTSGRSWSVADVATDPNEARIRDLMPVGAAARLLSECLPDAAEMRADGAWFSCDTDVFDTTTFHVGSSGVLLSWTESGMIGGRGATFTYPGVTDASIGLPGVSVVVPRTRFENALAAARIPSTLVAAAQTAASRTVRSMPSTAPTSTKVAALRTFAYRTLSSPTLDQYANLVVGHNTQAFLPLRYGSLSNGATLRLRNPYTGVSRTIQVVVTRSGVVGYRWPGGAFVPVR